MVILEARISSTSAVAGKAAYMLDPDAHQDHDDARPDERIKLIDVDNTMPVLDDMDSGYLGEHFAADLEDFTIDSRGNKKAPKDLALDLTISFSPKDDVTPESGLEIVKQMISDVMPGERSQLIVCHGDTDHLHFHALVSVVDSEGSIWNPTQSHRVWMKKASEIEIEHNLVQIDRQGAKEIKSPTSGEIQKAARTGEPSTRMQMQSILEEALTDRPDPQAFCDRLRDAGMTANPNVQSTGKISGITFELNGEIMKGGDLGRKFTGGRIASAVNHDMNNPEHLAVWEQIKDDYHEQDRARESSNEESLGRQPERDSSIETNSSPGRTEPAAIDTDNRSRDYQAPAVEARADTENSTSAESGRESAEGRDQTNAQDSAISSSSSGGHSFSPNSSPGVVTGDEDASAGNGREGESGYAYDKRVGAAHRQAEMKRQANSARLLAESIRISKMNLKRLLDEVNRVKSRLNVPEAEPVHHVPAGITTAARALQAHTKQKELERKSRHDNDDLSR